MTEEKYTLSYEYGDTGVTMTVGQGLDVHEMCAQFENFLLATGFRLRDGESVGITAADPLPSKTDDYMANLFEAGSGNHLRFDGANAWGEEAVRGRDYIGGDLGDDVWGGQGAVKFSGVPGGASDDLISLD